jgi:quercetin dioxygenase-like cupin family protein
VYRDPTDARGRADFEVIRDSATAKVPPEGNGRVVVVTATEATAALAVGGKGTVKVLLDPKATGSEALTLNLLEFPLGTEVPRHDHGRSTEILYMVTGEGKLSVGREDYPFASDSVLVLPAGQPHAIKFITERSDKAEKLPEKVMAVQFLTSARAAGAVPSPSSPAVAPTKPAGKTRPTQPGLVP